MATIQVRNVPDDVHRIYRMRAAAVGMSLQEYVLAELERNARLKTPAELVADVEARIRVEGMEGMTSTSSAAVVRADRDAH
ncbi:MAG TPA: hypothetical protein VF155_04280 [Candidatus Dormibacteraeota bacterium]